MDEMYGLGMLAALVGGDTCLHPLEFALIDGELWAATSRHARLCAGVPDGQLVEVVFLLAARGATRIRGQVRYSTLRQDRLRLWRVQPLALRRWYRGVHDPELVILQLQPEVPIAQAAFGDDDMLRWAA